MRSPSPRSPASLSVVLLIGSACAPSMLKVEGEPVGGEPAGADGGGSDGGAGGGGASDGGGADGGAADGGADGGGADGGADGGLPDDSALFQLDRIIEISIRLNPGGAEALGADPYTYVPAELTVDGEVFPEVGVRVKGRLGSYRPFPGKSALKVDLLEFGQDKRLYGHEKLNLNNMVQDCAKVKELTAYGIHRMLGTPAPRVAYAEVSVDGESYGLYTIVEVMDDVFLERHLDDPSGTLYDGDYHMWPDGSYSLVDFSTDVHELFEQDEGPDRGFADVMSVTAALDRFGFDPDGLWTLVDRDAHAALFAATAFTGHADSYSFYANNYRVYFDPAKDDRAVLFPWDPDWAFDGGMCPTCAWGRISGACMADAACMEAVGEALARLEAEAPGGEVAAQLDQARALIGPALRRDRYLELDAGTIAWCQDDVSAWLGRRGDELRAWGL